LNDPTNGPNAFLAIGHHGVWYVRFRDHFLVRFLERVEERVEGRIQALNWG
jgi:hypothetical protein